MLTLPSENFYPEYYQRYTSIVPDGDIFEILVSNKNQINNLLSGLSDKQAEYKYAEGKWSIKEVLGHIIDTERIFADRALRIARNDKTDIPQFDHDAYVKEGDFNTQGITALIEQYNAVHQASILLFKSLSDEAWERIGLSGGKNFIVKCFPFILAGHELHHLTIIKERYIPGI
ncbi:MAG: DinB family protein [Bacteroidetes bacterium]|nr:DinB family protein [Bacteroidota bacterium]